MKPVLCAIGCLSSMLMWGGKIAYIPDDTTNFCNPERGFYYHVEQEMTETGATNLSASKFKRVRDNGSTLLLRLYYLNNFTDKDLPQSVLDQINSDFALFRTNGCKAVLRFAYTIDKENPNDATPARWKSHLTQLKPVLQANADVIAAVQAGFLGAWGEWYYSGQGTGDEIPLKVKNDLITQLLDAVPTSRCVQLRTPAFKRDYVGDTTALPSAQAFSGTARARLGHHNDAFLYKADNMGTYTNREVDMNYLDDECLYVPNGGETDVEKEWVYEEWATGKKAQAEMAKLHYSYLNEGYAELTLNHWREDGSFDILARHMGYRLQLLETNIPTQAALDSALPIKMSIRNVGYAPMYNERKAYLVLRSASKTYTFLLNTDPRRWLPNGAVTLIDESIALPKDMPAGTYDLCLWLPDMDERIQTDSRFAVRLANQNIWEESTGYNVLTTIQISQQGGSDDPDPEPSSSVSPITNLQAEASQTSATLTWNNPDYGGEKTLTVDLSKGVKTTSKSASATITFSNKVSSITYSSTATWQSAGVEYPVNNLKDIVSISFEYKGDGTSNVLYPYAWDGDYRWRSEDYINLSSTDWQTYSYLPTVALWDDEPAHDFGDKPITQLGFIVNPASAGSGSFKIRNVKVTYINKVTADFVGLRLSRKEGSAPAFYSDGAAVYLGTDMRYEDIALKPATTYYYAAYAINAAKQIAYPAVCAVTTSGAPTTLDQLPDSSKFQIPNSKFIQNGQLYIQRNDKVYNTVGIEITTK